MLAVSGQRQRRFFSELEEEEYEYEEEEAAPPCTKRARTEDVEMMVACTFSFCVTLKLFHDGRLVEVPNCRPQDTVGELLQYVNNYFRAYNTPHARAVVWTDPCSQRRTQLLPSTQLGDVGAHLSSATRPLCVVYRIS